MTSRPGAHLPSESFLIEGFWPTGARDAFGAATARLDARLDAIRHGATGIRVVSATLVPGDEAAYWLVEAPSTEIVATACAEAGIRVDRIVGALELRAGKAVSPGRAPTATPMINSNITIEGRGARLERIVPAVEVRSHDTIAPAEPDFETQIGTRMRLARPVGESGGQDVDDSAG